MKTMKEEWICPDAQVKVFKAKDYCQQSCGYTGESKLIATCGDGTHEHHILFTIDAGGNISGNGGDETDPTHGSNGHLYRNQRNEWVYMGQLYVDHYSDHYPNIGGEFYPTSHSELVGQRVDPSDADRNHVVYCDCILSSPGAHHHLNEIKVYINMS